MEISSSFEEKKKDQSNFLVLDVFKCLYCKIVDMPKLLILEWYVLNSFYTFPVPRLGIGCFSKKSSFLLVGNGISKPQSWC